MVLKCTDCGKIFDYEELHIWSEPHGERWKGCVCGGECIEADKSEKER